ncbi:MAG: SMP-30/gluconolactonase/LRE family protein [Rhizomicrobium sp.]
MEGWEIAAENLEFPEGPVALSDGTLLVVEIRRQTLTRIHADGRVEVLCETKGGPNGLAIGPDGAVYICNNGGFEWHEAGGIFIPGHQPADYVTGSIQRFDLKTGELTTLYTACDGQNLRGPNDLVFDDQGGFWFTDHGKSRPESRDHGALYYAHIDGSHISRARSDLTSPNGIGLSPDQNTLYWADTITGRLWATAIERPGILKPPPLPWAPGTVIATLPGHQLLDSLKVEAGGKICVGTLLNGGITTFDPNGQTEHTPLPELAITNLCFGGKDMRDVWVTGSSLGRLYKGRWPRPGLKLAFNA